MQQGKQIVFKNDITSYSVLKHWFTLQAALSLAGLSQAPTIAYRFLSLRQSPLLTSRHVNLPASWTPPWVVHQHVKYNATKLI